jgi:AraC family transcriptional regulator
MEITPAPNGAFGGDRILALRECEVQPLIDDAPTGPLSPSRSLLVERFDLEPTDWQTHVHMDQVLVLYLKSARVQFERCDDRQIGQIQLNRGEFVICRRNHQESLRWRDPASLLCVRIGEAALNEAARSLLERDNIELRPELRVTDARVTNLLYALEAERAGGYLAGNLFTDSIEAALAGLLVTSRNGIQNNSVPAQGGLPPRRLHRVLEFMHANIDKPLRLEDIAAVAELSASHFLHQFRRNMNTSPYRYLLALRIEQSKRKLENRHLSVLEVAQSVGFDNPQHFATVFRRIAGVSPSTYRRHL